jgi:hypothetical protein
MNDNYAMNNEQVNGPVDAEESVEVRPEENIALLEQSTTPEAVESSKPSTWPTWLSGEEIEELQTRWNSIQVRFVDEPGAAVEQADTLVAEALKGIDRVFTNQRMILDEHWVNHPDITTEDRRIALKNYRSFFNHLLAG